MQRKAPPSLRALGCAIVAAIAVSAAIAASADDGDALIPLPPQPAGVAWPTAHWPEGSLPEGLDRERFDASVAALFEPRGRGGFRDTRALLVVQGGKLVFERYAEGFDRKSRFQSWSMAKSVTNAFIGLLVRDGRLDPAARAPVPQWAGADDPRRAITLAQLLEMRSGLANADGFGDGGADRNRSFISQLLFGEGAAAPAAYARDVPLAHPVGTRWDYSTGTSILLAAIAGEIVGGGARGTRDFLRRALFAPIGMTSAQPEFAASGEFLGGAFLHATARDWARFGLLYLRDGVWDGTRLLPRGWVDYSRRVNPADNNGVYGAHFWLNREPPSGVQWRPLPGGPSDVFMAEGANFQVVAMAPSRDLVAVRLGESQGQPAFPENKRPFGPLIAAFPELRSPAEDTP